MLAITTATLVPSYAQDAKAPPDAAAAAPPSGDWRIHPQLQVTERFSDNLTLSPQPKSGFVTKISPGVRVEKQGGRVKAKVDYWLDNLIYHGVDRKNSSSNRLSAKLNAELIDPWFYLDADATMVRSASSLLGTFGVDESTGGSFSDFTSINLTPKVRYRRGNLWTGEAWLKTSFADSSTSSLSNSLGNQLHLGVNSGSAFNTLGWSGSYTGEAIRYDAGTQEDSHRLDAGVSYRVRPRLRLLGNVGYESIQSDSLSEDQGGASWSIGALWQPTVRSSFQATAGRRFYGSSFGLSFSHRTRRTGWNLGYSESIANSRSQIELLRDPRAFAEALLGANPNLTEEERNRQVEIFLATLGDKNIIFTNQVYLQKRLQGSFLWETGKNSIVLSAFTSTRDVDAVSSRRSILFGNSDFNISRVIRQSGTSASWNWKFAPRTSTLSTLSTDLTEFIDIDREDQNYLLSFGLLHQLSRYASGIAEVRHQRRDSNFSADFDENSIEVGLQLSY